LRLSLGYSARRPNVGLLLLALATETLRRDSRERGIWQIFSKVDWSEKVRELLFANNGYPHKDVRDCFEDACRCFHLRHAFDMQHQDAWYLTAKLQFGFTLNGAREQLAFWLVGNPHAAIRELTEGNTKSEQFIDLWSTLRGYRDGRIPEPFAKRVIGSSAWVRPEWTDDILAAAKKPVGSAHSSCTARVDNSFDTHDAKIEGHELELSSVDSNGNIVTDPRIYWEEGQLNSRCRLNRNALQSLRGSVYFLSVDGINQELFRRQADGTFLGMKGITEIRLPIDCGPSLVTLSEPTGSAVICQSISFADVNSFCQIFDANGKHIKLSSIKREASFTMRLPIGTIITSTVEVHRFHTSNSLWIELPPNWDPQTLFLLPGDFEPLQLLREETQNAIDWTTAVSISMEPNNRNKQTRRLRILLPPDTSLLSAYIGESKLTIECEQGNRFVSSPFFRPTGRHDGKFDVRLILKRERLRVVCRSLEWERQGIVQQRNGEWRPVLQSDIVDRTELTRCMVAISPGETQRTEPWTMFEGNRIVRHPSFDRPTRLLDLGSRGHSISLSDHQFNRSSSEAKQIRLVGSVIDKGIVIDGVQKPGSKQVAMDLRDPMEIAPGYHVVIWTKAGKLANIASEDIRTSEMRWTVDPKLVGIDERDPVVAAAIAYKGTRLGSWWSEKWWEVIDSVDSESHADSAAVCLRWFRLPLRLATEKINSIVRRFSWPFFDRWTLGWLPQDSEYLLTEIVIADDLLVADLHEIGWNETARLLLEQVQIDGQKLAKLYEIPITFDDRKSLQELVEQLTTWNPVLAAKCLDAWLIAQEVRDGEDWLRREISVALVEPLKRRRLEMNEHSGGDFGTRDPRIPWLDLSDVFVDSLVKTARENLNSILSDQNNQNNLETALNKVDLCRLIASELIREKTRLVHPLKTK